MTVKSHVYKTLNANLKKRREMIKAALLIARMADFSFHSCMKFVLKCKNVLPKCFFFFNSEVFKGTRFFCFLYGHFGG